MMFKGVITEEQFIQLAEEGQHFPEVQNKISCIWISLACAMVILIIVLLCGV